VLWPRWALRLTPTHWARREVDPIVYHAAESCMLAMIGTGEDLKTVARRLSSHRACSPTGGRATRTHP